MTSCSAEPSSESSSEPSAEPSTKRYTARFEPAARTFEVEAGQPLLLAAEQAGVAMPSSCRNGTCRTCMCLLLQGSISYRIEWPGLLAEEKAEGWILPCVAYPESDVVLENPFRI